MELSSQHQSEANSSTIIMLPHILAAATAEFVPNQYFHGADQKWSLDPNGTNIIPAD